MKIEELKKEEDEISKSASSFESEFNIEEPLQQVNNSEYSMKNS